MQHEQLRAILDKARREKTRKIMQRLERLALASHVAHVLCPSASARYQCAAAAPRQCSRKAFLYAALYCNVCNVVR